MSIDLRIAGETGIGEIVLTGDDRSTVEALWADAKKAGSIPMPRFDDRRYGDVVLEVHAAGRTGRPTSVVPSPSAGTLPAPFDHFVRYRYEFVGDRLDAARAWGAGADFQIVARATDRLRCEFADSVGFVDSFRAVCAELLAAYPNFLWLCP